MVLKYIKTMVIAAFYGVRQDSERDASHRTRSMIKVVVCGLWFVVCGLWFVVCGLWFVVC